jgi:diguanylate cyclase (GGDEF)-like protein
VIVPAKPHDQVTEKKSSKATGLLHSLVPRAQVFCLYDPGRNCVWTSGGADDFEVENFVAMLPQELIDELDDSDEILKRTLPSARTALVLPVLGDDRELLGFLVSLFSKNAGQSASFNPNILKTILEPAIELIGEGLKVDRELAESYSRKAEVEKELALVYEVDEKIHGVSKSHSSLAQLVGQSGRYLGINYSVLLIPSKRIRISATHSSWKNVNRKVVDRYLTDQLLPRLEGQRQPLIFDIPAVEGSTKDAEQGYQTLVSPLLDKYGNVEGLFAQLGRVDKQEFTNSDRRFMSHIVRKVEYVIEQSFDSMTGLMNRSGFEAQLIESSNALKSKTDTHQLIYFDLDNLQLVNDTFSRKAGDDVIIRFARLLEEDLPSTAVLSRLTGDEFCILLAHADPEKALKLANEIREKRSALRYLEGDKSLQITMSVGIAEFSHAAGDEGSALTTARMACESAKDHGRDRVEVFDVANQSIIRRYDDMQLVAEIQQALDESGFELRAQPIASLNGVQGNPRYEILLRMSDADGNRVPTGALFSAAERYHMMPQIDRWVLSNTISTLAATRDSVNEAAAIFSINLSGQSLGDDDIYDFIEEEVRASRVSPASLCFEITESAAVSNLAKAQSFIDRLRKFGCTISLDDFGAGLSSFAYLKNFNVDTLKIDGSFIRDITENRISESMVAAIAQVADVMELQTVGEYVESELTRKLLSKLGVDFAQGHFIGKPVPLDAVLSGLADTTLTSAV